MFRRKIEELKKELANKLNQNQITDQQYQKIMRKLEQQEASQQAKALNNQLGIKNDLQQTGSKDTEEILYNKTKKDKTIKDQLIYQGVDLEHYLNPILVLRTVSNNKSLEDLAKKFRHKSSFTLLIELFYLCNSQGEVRGISREQLIKPYGYTDGAAAYRGLNELEEANIINIDRSLKPHQYQIINYAQNMKKGGFVISRDTMIEEAKNLLKKDYRALFYNCFRRQHSPVNKRAKNTKLSTLKGYINAGSFKEVIRIYKRLEGRLLKKAKVVTDRFKKGDNLIKFVYDNVKMRIIKNKKEVIKQVKNHWLYDELKSIYQLIGIKLTINNLKQGYQLIEKYGEGCLKAVQHNLDKFDKSKTGRVGYFEFMLNQAKIGAIL